MAHYEGFERHLIARSFEGISFDAPLVNGYEILNKYFDTLFETNNKVFAFGEDVGFIGDVNQGFSGLQEKHGDNRILDTGIRELSIIGQGIGMALRGLRPIAEAVIAIVDGNGVGDTVGFAHVVTPDPFV